MKQGVAGHWIGLLVLVVGLTGCSTFGGGGGDASEAAGRRDEVVASWETDREHEFVRLVRTDRRHPEHPVRVDESALAKAMRELYLRADGDSDPLFLDEQIVRLAPLVAQALQRAAPDQEVTFAAVGKHGGFGPFAPRLATTARVFVDGGALQLIVGLAHASYGYPVRETGYKRPFTPGSPEARVEDGWVVEAPDAPAVSIRPRGDWVTVDLAALQGGTAAGGQAAGGTGGDEAPAAERTRTPRERLQTLEALHEDGLITDEEYEAKREAIIDQI